MQCADISYNVVNNVVNHDMSATDVGLLIAFDVLQVMPRSALVNALPCQEQSLSQRLRCAPRHSTTTIAFDFMLINGWMSLSVSISAIDNTHSNDDIPVYDA